MCCTFFFNENGTFLTQNEFNRKHGINTPFLSFNGCKMSIRKYAQRSKLNLTNNCIYDIPIALKTIYSVSKGTKLYYDTLSNDKKLPNSCQKWCEKMEIDISWEKVFNKVHKIQDVRLKWLQLRIIHRILGTNVVLKEMGVIDSNYCDFCMETKDSIEHIFWTCNNSKHFWENFEELLKAKCETCTNINLSKTVILFGFDKNVRTDYIFDFLILLGKMYIYGCKFDKSMPNVTIFENYLSSRYKIEQYNAKISGKINDFKKKWMPYESLIRSAS